MADKHPYLSGIGAIHQSINHLRKSFPNEVTSETLKKLGIAKNNESKIISILKFINLLDENGTKTEQAAKTFVIHSDEEFQNEFSNHIKDAYSGLFDLFIDDAWSLDLDKLIGYFRQTDQTSSTVGRYQSVTFQALATLAGKIEASSPKTTQPKKKKPEMKQESLKKKEPKKTINPPTKPVLVNNSSDIGLTVRVEINLPANADKDTYDAIFKSIRENLIESK